MTVMNKGIFPLFGIIIMSVSIGLGIGATAFSTHIVEKETITIDTNPDLELRLQSEIDSNQIMTQTIQDVILACNEKLEEQYSSTNEALKKENEILQKALYKLRDT